MGRARYAAMSGDRRTDLARAAVRVASTIGYEAMTVADIAEAAGVVRRTFSRYFPDKATAFAVGYQEITDDLRTTIQTAYDAGSTPTARARDCLRALAEFLASDPARAEALLVHGHAAGARTQEVHCETMRRLVQLILENAAGLPPPGGDPRVVAETVAGGIYQVVYTRTLRGEVQDLPQLVPEWTAAAMAPYVAIARRPDQDAAE